MTQITSEVQIIESGVEPLDAHMAEGIAINDVFCEVQRERVASRLTDMLNRVQEDTEPAKNRSYTIALAVGRITLESEDMVDEFIHQAAHEHNHGLRTGRKEPKELGDVVWKGHDPNSNRYLTLFKRTSQTVMTDYSVPYVTIWELKAHPKTF